MILVLNRQNNGFIERKPGGTPGRLPFHVGAKAVSPKAGDCVFVGPGGDSGKVNTLLAKAGLKKGRLMGGHEYLVEAGSA